MASSLSPLKEDVQTQPKANNMAQLRWVAVVNAVLFYALVDVVTVFVREIYICAVLIADLDATTDGFNYANAPTVVRGGASCTAPVSYRHSHVKCRFSYRRRLEHNT